MQQPTGSGVAAGLAGDGWCYETEGRNLPESRLPAPCQRCPHPRGGTWWGPPVHPVTSKDKRPPLQPLKRTLHVTSLLQCPHRGRGVSASFHWQGTPASAQKRQVCAAAKEWHAGTHTGCSRAGAGARTGQDVAGPPLSAGCRGRGSCVHTCAVPCSSKRVFAQSGTWDVC